MPARNRFRSTRAPCAETVGHADPDAHRPRRPRTASPGSRSARTTPGKPFEAARAPCFRAHQHPQGGRAGRPPATQGRRGGAASDPSSPARRGGACAEASEAIRITRARARDPSRSRLQGQQRTCRGGSLRAPAWPCNETHDRTCRINHAARKDRARCGQNPRCLLQTVARRRLQAGGMSASRLVTGRRRRRDEDVAAHAAPRAALGRRLGADPATSCARSTVRGAALARVG